MVAYNSGIELTMTAKDLILELFENFPQLSTEIILNNLPIKKGTMYSAIQRMVMRKIIEKQIINHRIFIRLLKKYREFRYTLRVIDTHTNPRTRQHKWDADLEITMKGVAPIQYDEKMIRDTFREKLFERGLVICSNTEPPILMGVPAELIEIEDMASRGVSGVELGKEVKEYDPNQEVELVLTNNIGRVYDKAMGLYDSYQMRLDEYK